MTVAPATTGTLNVATTGSNSQILESLYNQIAVLEMIEMMQNCGLVWNKISPTQWQSTLVIGNDVWDIYLTQMPTFNNVIMDIRRNTVFFASLNSNDLSFISDLFNQIETNDDFAKDTSFLQDVQQFLECGPQTDDEYTTGVGLWANGTHIFHYTANPQVLPAGVLGSVGVDDGSGKFFSVIYNPLVVPAGLWASGDITINDIVVDPFGVLGGGAAIVEDEILIVPAGVIVPGPGVDDGSGRLLEINNPASGIDGPRGSGVAVNTEFFYSIVIAPAGALAGGAAIIS